MADITIRARAREVLGKKTQTLRHAGDLPAVLYGKGVDALSLTVNLNEFQRAYRMAGESTLIDLAVERAAPVKVIIQEVQRHPVTSALLHVDFRQVNMAEKITTEIPLVFTGESAAVKELGGVLVKNLDEIEVKSLPGDLVHEIKVDISALQTFEDIIHVGDLALPKGIEPLADAKEVICLVTPPRSEKELAELEEKVEEKVEAVEGVKKEEPTEETAEAAEEPKDKPE